MLIINLENVSAATTFLTQPPHIPLWNDATKFSIFQPVLPIENFPQKTEKLKQPQHFQLPHLLSSRNSCYSADELNSSDCFQVFLCVVYSYSYKLTHQIQVNAQAKEEINSTNILASMGASKTPNLNHSNPLQKNPPDVKLNENSPPASPSSTISTIISQITTPMRRPTRRSTTTNTPSHWGLTTQEPLDSYMYPLTTVYVKPEEEAELDIKARQFFRKRFNPDYAQYYRWYYKKLTDPKYHKIRPLFWKNSTDGLIQYFVCFTPFPVPHKEVYHYIRMKNVDIHIDHELGYVSTTYRPGEKRLIEDFYGFLNWTTKGIPPTGKKPKTTTLLPPYPLVRQYD